MSRWVSKSNKAAEVHRRFVRIAGKELPSLVPAVKRIGPVWLPSAGEKDLARYLCRVIVGQQLSMQAARTIWGRVEERLEASNERVPHCLSRSDARRLRACGLSAAKTKAVLEIGKAVQAGVLEERALRRLPHEQRAAALQQIWGVGAWTTDMVSMFYFREEDIWPGGDLGVRNALYGFLPRRPRDAKAGERAALRVAEKFAPHRSILALYLWRSLESPPQ